MARWISVAVLLAACGCLESAPPPAGAARPSATPAIQALPASATVVLAVPGLT